MRTRGLQPRLLYPARLSIKMEGQVKSFPEKKKPQRIYLQQTSSKRDVKGFALRTRTKTVKERGTQVQTNGNE